MAEIANIVEDFGTEAATISPEKRPKIHVPLLLRCVSIDAACGHDRDSVEAGVVELHGASFRSLFRAHGD